MIQKITLLCVVLFPMLLAAQKKSTVQGVVIDTAARQVLAYTTVSVVQAKDSTLVAFVRADSTGKFKFPSLDPGKYLLSASYVGYVPVWKPIELKAAQNLDLGQLILTDLLHAGNITVHARRAPVVMNGDTVEFNTENFKTQPNAVVEDMLKRLPGMTVDNDGTVRVNGERINRVLVNGKEFFTGDPKLATKNLNADDIDKVQVFDKKSDRSEFTGVDDGQTEKAINLKMKKDRNTSLFGKVTAGAGTRDRYDGQTNVNQFNGDKQLSLLGMANNTNRQGFSINDVMNFSGDMTRMMRSGGGNINIRIGGGGDDNGLPVTGLGQNQQGVARTMAGGINFNNNWNKKIDLNSSGILSDIQLQTNRNTNRQNLLPGNSFNYASNSNSFRNSKQQRWNAAIDYNIDSFNSIKFTPQVTLQQNDNRTYTSYLSENSNAIKLNDGYSDVSTHSEAINLAGTALYRKRFAKKGRTLSATVSMGYNNSTQSGDQRTRNTFYSGGVAAKDSLTNQTNNREGVTRNLGTNLVYTEPIGKRALIEMNAFYSNNTGESKRNAYDFNGGSGKYDRFNTVLSNDFKSAYVNSGGGFAFRSNQPKLNYSLGANLQSAVLNSTNNTNGNTIRQTFTDLLPSMSMQYRIQSTKSLTLNYNTSTSQPSNQQLQPVFDVSDPLNTYTGNPNLKRSYNQSVNLHYASTNPFTQRSLFGLIAANLTNQAIVNSDQILPNGSRVSMPVNANGVMFVFANVNAGFPLKKLKSRIDLGLSSNYNRNISFVNNARNEISNRSISPSLNYNFSLEGKIDIQASSRISISKASYTLQPQLNSNYLQQNYGIEMTNYLPGGLVMNHNFNYSITSGRADGFNTKVPFWNASLAKGFLKNKRAELKFSVYDLLNKNIGVNRSANQNYLEDTRYNVLQRYFLLSFTFSLNKAGNTAQGARMTIRTVGG